MWRRASSSLAAAPWRSALRPNLHRSLASMPSPFQNTTPLFSESGNVESAKKRVEDVMPIATGHEREEIEAELEGKKRFDMDAPCGPFGTKNYRERVECTDGTNWTNPTLIETPNSDMGMPPSSGRRCQFFPEAPNLPEKRNRVSRKKIRIQF